MNVCWPRLEHKEPQKIKSWRTLDALDYCLLVPLIREKYKFKPFFFLRTPPFLNSKMGICNPANCCERFHCIKLRTLRLEMIATLLCFLPLGTGSHHTHSPLGRSCGGRCISGCIALHIFSSLLYSLLSDGLNTLSVSGA